MKKKVFYWENEERNLKDNLFIFSNKLKNEFKIKNFLCFKNKFLGIFII